MRIHRLTLRDFRGVAERTVELSPTGITIVEGDNEAGKTSLVEALDLLLDYRDDSTAAAVRAAKPAGSDVGAFVEAELSAGPYRFTYAKRFNKDRSTTLTVHEPRAEQLSGRPAHDRVNAILDDFVDRPLWAALRLQQGVALDQADLTSGGSLASALDAAAGAGLGGDRESSVFERVQAEYERYHTATGRPNKLLTGAAARFEAARDEADRLSQELDELDRDVDRSAALSRAIEERRQELTTQRRRADDLESSARALERRADEVEQLRLTLGLATAARDQATQAAEARRALVAEADAAEQAAGDLADTADIVAPELTDAEKAVEAAAANLRELHEVVDHRRARVLAAEATRDRVQLGGQLADLHRLQARVEEAGTALRTADAELQALTVDAAVLTRIETAERAVTAARAALETDAATVAVRALGPLDVGVDGTQRPLEADEELTLPLGEAVRLRIGDHAEVRVTAGDSARQRAAALTEARANLERCCAAVGCADPEAVRTAYARRQEVERARSAARSQLDAALGDLTPDLLADRVARLRERLGAEAAPAEDPGAEVEIADLDAAEDAVRSARRALEEAMSAHEAAQTEQRIAAEAVAAVRTRAALLADRAESARARHDELRARLAAARAELSDDALAAHVRATGEAAERAELDYGEAAAALEARDPETARAEADHAAAVVGRLAEELRRDEDELRDVRARLLVRGEQGLHDAFDAARGALEQAERERTRLEAQAAAARLLYERMSANRDAARRAYAAPFREKLERLGAIVFGESLRVELDDDLRIVRRTLGGTTLDYDQLSSGAREQLAVLARLACAAIIGSDGGVPLILDDALGYSDPTRLERLGAAFRVGARQTQVIVLTCVPERYQHVGDATVVRL